MTGKWECWAHRRLRGDRVLLASLTQPLRVFALRVTPDLRGALHDWRGLFFVALLAGLVVMS